MGRGVSEAKKRSRPTDWYAVDRKLELKSFHLIVDIIAICDSSSRGVIALCNANKDRELTPRSPICSDQGS